MAFHQTIVHGRIGKDIECNYSTSGVAITKFSVAVSEKFNGEEKTTWYNVTAFKGTAENIAKFFKKGSEIILIGNMSFGSYEKDGQTKYTSDLIVRSFDFCGSKNDSQSQTMAQQQNGGFNSNQQQQNNGFQKPDNQQGFQKQGPQDDSNIPF